MNLPNFTVIGHSSLTSCGITLLICSYFWYFFVSPKILGVSQVFSFLPVFFSSYLFPWGRSSLGGFFAAHSQCRPIHKTSFLYFSLTFSTAWWTLPFRWPTGILNSMCKTEPTIFLSNLPEPTLVTLLRNMDTHLVTHTRNVVIILTPPPSSTPHIKPVTKHCWFYPLKLFQNCQLLSLLLLTSPSHCHYLSGFLQLLLIGLSSFSLTSEIYPSYCRQNTLPKAQSDHVSSSFNLPSMLQAQWLS